MSNTSSIEWTATINSDGSTTPGSSWNPVTGCTEVSPGCDHCYARTFAERFRGVPGNHFEQGFDLKLWPDRLMLPHKWRKPRRVFVNSMSDLFHQDVPDAFILEVFNTMALTPRHTYQVLTKRPSRLVNTGLTDKILSNLYHLTGSGLWPSHIWMGVSVENQRYDWRIDKLRDVPAPVRFISAEPLLGDMTLNLYGLSWLIAGCESGYDARPMDENWVRHLRNQCRSGGIAFFYKQRLDERGHKISLPELDGKIWNQFPVTEKQS